MLKRSFDPSSVSMTLIGIFALTAGIASWIPGLAFNRYELQFLPIATAVLGDGPLAPIIATSARMLISLVECIAGLAILIGLMRAGKYRAGVSVGCSLLIALFGIFLLVTFSLHHTPGLKLPPWNQYPVFIVWFLLTWHLMERDHRFERAI